MNIIDSSGLYGSLVIRGGIIVASRIGFPNAARIVATAMGGGVIACAITGYCSTSDDNKDSCPIPGTTPGVKTRGPTDQREKDGGVDAANNDFDNLDLSDERDIPGIGRVGTLPDGRIVIIRPNSSDGRPAIEVQDGRSRIKVRYNE